MNTEIKVATIDNLKDIQLLNEQLFDEEFTKYVKRLKVLVTAKNKQAIKFYKKKGFNDYNITLEMDL